MNKALMSSFLFFCFPAVLFSQASRNIIKYVNPFIGTSGTGHTYPSAACPFGLIQLGPETGNEGWEYCAGYQYKDSLLRGFTHTRLSGTGVADLSDLLILPYMGNEKIGYRSAFKKTTEKASPGYYEVFLSKDNILVKLTATTRTGYHQYTFKRAGDAHLLLSADNGVPGSEKTLARRVQQCTLNLTSRHLITGSLNIKGWVNRQVYFAVYLSKAIASSRYVDDNKHRMVVDFNVAANEVLQLRVGLSTVSIKGAERNLAESEGKTFNQVLRSAQAAWIKYLSRIMISGTETQKTNFYTSVYHALLQPNIISDIDGGYRGQDDQIHYSADGVYFSTLSLWDTFRAAHPLYTLIAPRQDAMIVHSMLDHFSVKGILPIWELWGKENYCMIGNHSVPVIVDAYLKGIVKDRKSEAFAAIKQSLTQKGSLKDNWRQYDQYGYIPADSSNESVSRLLEATYDDWCAAQMAKFLNKPDDYAFFIKRSGFYANVFDKSTGFMRGKLADGSWESPFDPYLLGHGAAKGGNAYTEGNAWQYTWHVLHDIPGLVSLMGGQDKFGVKLDSLFSIDSRKTARGFSNDVTGLIGQYAHGNEPSHHVAYLFNYAGKPWRTQELIPKILNEQYQALPDGLSGNDDCGQMSAWYVFSSMGFYPVNPASAEFEIGVPSFRKSEIKFRNKSFVIQAPLLSEKRRYIQQIKLNGKNYKSYHLAYKNITEGGVLEFVMGEKPRDIR